MKLSSYIFSILLLNSIVSCGNKEAVKETHTEETENVNNVELTPEQYKMVAIQLEKISMKALSGTIKVNGMLDLPPQSKVSISTPFTGTLKSTEMLQGKKVRKGEAIALLEHPDYIQIQQDYLEQKSQLEYLKADYERQNELAEENVNAKKTFQKSKSDYNSMLARISGLKAKLKMMNINMSRLEKGQLQNTITLYSPINGYVTEVNTNIGATVSPSDVLFEIADTEHLHVELTVFEKDVPKLKIGQKVRFTLANEQKERMATVYLIGREINQERIVHVHCHLDQEDNQLLPGMYLQALVESGSEKVTALPNQAVVEFEGEHYIFVALPKSQDKRNNFGFEMVKVKTGIQELGYTQISFLENKDLKTMDVVINGAYDLLSKIKNTAEEE
ncbi:MAG: efflux RND transporter periplasmic adaptor subunit [Pelobium sp.]